MAAGGGVVIVGVLSDTHGNVLAARAAVKILLARGATKLIHCGDVGNGHGDAFAVLDELAGTNAAFVYGNNDHDADDLEDYAATVGIECLQYGGQLTLDGLKIAVTHGDDADTVRRFLAPANKADYLLTGHSHRVHDERIGRTRCINPGALYRAKTKTVATIDLATGKVEWIEVPGV